MREVRASRSNGHAAQAVPKCNKRGRIQQEPRVGKTRAERRRSAPLVLALVAIHNRGDNVIARDQRRQQVLCGRVLELNRLLSNTEEAAREERSSQSAGR